MYTYIESIMKITRAWLDKINGLPKQKFVRVEENFYVFEKVENGTEMGLHKEIAKKNGLIDKIETINDLDAGFTLRIRDRLFLTGESESLGLPRLFNMSEMRQRSLNLLRRDFSDFIVEEM